MSEISEAETIAGYMFFSKRKLEVQKLLDRIEADAKKIEARENQADQLYKRIEALEKVVEAAKIDIEHGTHHRIARALDELDKTDD